MEETKIIYPTPQHEAAANSLVFYFSNHDDVEAILLTGSCARKDRATKDSCLDFAVILRSDQIDKKKVHHYYNWENCYNREKVFSDLRNTGKFSHIDLDIIDCEITPQRHGFTTGADHFELEIGNYFFYSQCLYEKDNYFSTRKKNWLPYYPEKLRVSRLEMVTGYFYNNLDHIPLMLQRDLVFHAFSRFYNAFEEFLQALFISRRTYPISYDKWIKEQLVEILDLPSLYEETLDLFNLDLSVPDSLNTKALKLKKLMEKHIR